jgi:hypothetical protein
MSALASKSLSFYFHVNEHVLTSTPVGYDTAVIGGTMALDSFRRDFGTINIPQTQRDTIQGNIVSTFQVCTHDHACNIQSLSLV